MQAGKKIVAGMLALALTIQGVPMQRGTAVQAAGQTTETAPLQGTDGAITDGTDAAAGMVSGG